MTASLRIRLRPVEDDDLPIILEHRNDPVAAAMVPSPRRDPDTFYAHWAEIRADPNVDPRTIVADVVVVGDITTWLEDRDRLMTAHVARDNIGSRRVVEHCGFVRVRDAVADDGVHETIFRLD